MRRPSSVRNSSTASMVVERGAINAASPPVAMHAGVRVLLGTDSLDQAVDQRGVAVDDARLDRVHRRPPDDLRRPRELDARQLGRARDERVERDADARDDHAAGVLALRRDDVEGGRRAEVDHDRRARHALGGGHRVRDAIRADLLRVVVQDRDAGAHARTHDQRGLPEEPLAQLLDALVHGRHDAAEDDAAHGRSRHAPVGEEASQHDHPLVDGARRIGSQAPVHRQGRRSRRGRPACACC